MKRLLAVILLTGCGATTTPIVVDAGSSVDAGFWRVDAGYIVIRDEGLSCSSFCEELRLQCRNFAWPGMSLPYGAAGDYADNQTACAISFPCSEVVPREYQCSVDVPVRQRLTQLRCRCFEPDGG
jgi:hypothetical protein